MCDLCRFNVVFLLLHHKPHDFEKIKKIIEREICVFDFFVQLLCEASLVLRKIEVDAVINSYLSSIQPLGRFSRNQSPVRRPVWLWHAASWASS